MMLLGRHKKQDQKPSGPIDLSKMRFLASNNPHLKYMQQ